LNVLRKNINEGKPGAQRLYGEVISKIDATPELLASFSDISSTEPHQDIIEMLLATLFPPSVSERENIYAVAFPLRYKVIYSSKLFQNMFMIPGTNEIVVPDNVKGSQNHNRLDYAYRLILKKFFGYETSDFAGAVYPYVDPATGLTRYLELNIDTRFVDVNPIGELPPLPENVVCKKTNRMMPLKELKEKLPLEKFVFEGLTIIKISDVTEQEMISQLKNTLLSFHTFTDPTVYEKLQATMKSLLGMKDIKVGITPLIHVNNHYVYSPLHNCNSIIFKHTEAVKEQNEVCDCFEDILREYDQPIVYQTLEKKDIVELESLKLYYELGARSVIISPLKENGRLLGLLEIVSDTN
jgi:hypothetical protein